MCVCILMLMLSKAQCVSVMRNKIKMFIKCMFDPGLLSKIYEVLKLNNKKINYLITEWTTGLNRYLTEEDTQMASKHVKRDSTSYVAGNCKLKGR